MRYSGEVHPRIPASAPLSYRLSQEVYALDGIPEEALGAEDYILPYPGGRLEVGPGGKLYETLGADTAASTLVKTLENPLYRAVSAAGVIAGAYHGYKRNKSVLWAFVWATLGGIAPFVTLPISLAQGFGKPKRK